MDQGDKPKIDESAASGNAKSCSNLDNSSNQQKETKEEKLDKTMKTESKKGVSILPKMKKAERETMPLLAIDDVFRKRWHIEGLIGKGGYGEIYLAIDMKRTEEVAIKAEPKVRRGKLAKRMILEQKVLVKMQGKPHVPMVFASGHTERINFIIMQLLSINVGEIRKASPVKKLSKSTTGRILVQSIAALRDLHEAGYVHRDVKPANMCFGINSKNRHVLVLLDFGLIRRYKTETGEWRQPRSRAGFRGTHRYVSVRVHSRLEQSSTDDMISLLYTGYELLIGELPWKSLERNEEIKKLKESMQNMNTNYFATNDLSDFAQGVFNLDPSVDPPYTQLQDQLKSLVGNKKLTDPYDWEEDYKEAIEEAHESDHESVK